MPISSFHVCGSSPSINLHFLSARVTDRCLSHHLCLNWRLFLYLRNFSGGSCHQICCAVSPAPLSLQWDFGPRAKFCLAPNLSGVPLIISVPPVHMLREPALLNFLVFAKCPLSGCNTVYSLSKVFPCSVFCLLQRKILWLFLSFCGYICFSWRQRRPPFFFSKYLQAY